MNAIDVALICKALGDANRLEIVKMLSDGEKCGCKLLERFEITQPTLSHHMKILVECGLVNARKEGKWQHYSLNCETLTQFKEFIEGLTCCGCGSNSEGGAAPDGQVYHRSNPRHEVAEYADWKSTRHIGIGRNKPNRWEHSVLPL